MAKKKKAKPKQRPEAEPSLFEKFCFLHPLSHPKVIENILKNLQKTSMSVLIKQCDEWQ